MSKVSLAHFWLSVETEFSQLAKKAVKVLIPFTSTQGRTGHLCVLENHRTAGRQRSVSGPSVVRQRSIDGRHRPLFFMFVAVALSSRYRRTTQGLCESNVNICVISRTTDVYKECRRTVWHGWVKQTQDSHPGDHHL